MPRSRPRDSRRDRSADRRLNEFQGALVGARKWQADPPASTPAAISLGRETKRSDGGGVVPAQFLVEGVTCPREHCLVFDPERGGRRCGVTKCSREVR